MPLHLIKLAVGCESIKELKGWVAERMATAKKKGLPLRHIHITRMTPKRDAEILAGGSLYWVIRGEIAARAAAPTLPLRPLVAPYGRRSAAPGS